MTEDIELEDTPLSEALGARQLRAMELELPDDAAAELREAKLCAEQEAADARRREAEEKKKAKLAAKTKLAAAQALGPPLAEPEGGSCGPALLMDSSLLEFAAAMAPG